MKARWVILIIVLTAVLLVIGSCFMCCRGSVFYGPVPGSGEDSGDVVMLQNHQPLARSIPLSSNMPRRI